MGCLQRGYDGELLGGTFSRAVFVGNGLVAIVAGLVAHTLVETLALGPVIPFDTAALVMICGGVIVAITWTENFGNSSEKRNFLDQLKSGAHAIASGEHFFFCQDGCGLQIMMPATSKGAAHSNIVCSWKHRHLSRCRCVTCVAAHEAGRSWCAQGCVTKAESHCAIILPCWPQVIP